MTWCEGLVRALCADLGTVLVVLFWVWMRPQPYSLPAASIFTLVDCARSSVITLRLPVGTQHCTALCIECSYLLNHEHLPLSASTGDIHWLLVCIMQVGGLIKRLDTGEGSYAKELEEDYEVAAELDQVCSTGCGADRVV
eukprot:GHUV01036965.1.p1 GENE.GHUV01036965.1~~GHUV01036965.1.p1  ORF type:complete len:140 (-),score=26.66 GHUV01036965.1:98-517(-)